VTAVPSRVHICSEFAGNVVVKTESFWPVRKVEGWPLSVGTGAKKLLPVPTGRTCVVPVRLL
jgi:hypothetical protein